MTELRHRTVESSGIRMHLAEQGEGPLVLLCHGFPELWYSWRHQLPALADAGFHAVAPDMRGYGQTDRPDAIDQYTLLPALFPGAGSRRGGIRQACAPGFPRRRDCDLGRCARHRTGIRHGAAAG
jgi:pimeloyl-ACP methyl ester carboxylesterase